MPSAYDEGRRLGERDAVPVLARVEATQELDQLDGIDVPKAARVRIVALQRRRSGTTDHVPHTKGVGAQEVCLQRHHTLLPCRDGQDGFEAGHALLYEDGKAGGADLGTRAAGGADEHGGRALVLEDLGVLHGLVDAATGRRSELADDDELLRGELLHETARCHRSTGARGLRGTVGPAAGGTPRDRSQALNSRGDRLDVSRSGAAAAAHERGAGLHVARGVSGKVGGIGGVLEPSVHEGRRAGVRLRRERERRVLAELREDLEQPLRPVRAVRSEGSEAHAFNFRCHFGGRFAGEGLAVFEEGHLGHNRQVRRDLLGGVYSLYQLVQAAKCLEDDQVHAAFSQGADLLLEGLVQDGAGDAATGATRRRRAHRAGHQHGPVGGGGGGTGRSGGSEVDVDDGPFDAVTSEAGAACTKRVGLDDVGAGGDVSAVDRLHEVLARQAQLRERNIKRDAGSLQHRAHGAVTHENARTKQIGRVFLLAASATTLSHHDDTSDCGRPQKVAESHVLNSGQETWR